eukprot:6346656-Amphidinium_carterae.1
MGQCTNHCQPYLSFFDRKQYYQLIRWFQPNQVVRWHVLKWRPCRQHSVLPEVMVNSSAKRRDRHSRIGFIFATVAVSASR